MSQSHSDQASAAAKTQVFPFMLDAGKKTEVGQTFVFNCFMRYISWFISCTQHLNLSGSQSKLQNSYTKKLSLVCVQWFGRAVVE